MSSIPTADHNDSSPKQNRFLGLLLLAAGTVIFAASFAVLAKIIEQGETHLVEGRNLISFCNVLLAGNLIAGLIYLIIFRKDAHPSKFRQISKRSWGPFLLVSLIEGAIAPTLLFLALTETSVAAVVILQSIKVPLILVVGYIMYREVSNRFAVIGSIIATIGIAIMLYLSLKMEGGAGGMIKVALASVLLVVAVQLRRRLSNEISIGVYSHARIFLGTLFFFIAMMTMKGPEHFTDLFEPFLWKWMMVYACAIVVLGQITWQLGLKTANSTDLYICEAMFPLLGMLFGYWILAKVPAKFELIGAAIILLGITLTVIGAVARHKSITRSRDIGSRQSHF